MDHLHHHNPNYLISTATASGDTVDRDRFPQWTHAETKEFLAIRAELDRRFTQTKRNKPLWDETSARMQARGFARTPDQCKSKWKNLVTRFKASEAMEDNRQFQFPFHDDMKQIFSQRMERLLLLDKRKASVESSNIEEDDDDDDDDDNEEDNNNNNNKNKKKKKRRRKVERSTKGAKSMTSERDQVEMALREFGEKQMEMERRWMEAAEMREAERRWKEEEWRREMEALEAERAAVERQWMEREEERRAREEARDERRHAVITAILMKLGSSDM